MTDLSPRRLDETLYQAEAVCDSNNIAKSGFVTTGHFGHGALISDGEGYPSWIEWKVRSSGGAREIWALYASEDIRPADIIINDRLEIRAALSDVTGGWHEPNQMWWFQQNVTLELGENRIRIVGAGALPHIRALAVCDISGEGLADVASRRAAESRGEDRVPFNTLPLEASNHAFDLLHAFYLGLRRLGVPDAQITGLARDYLGMFSLYHGRPEAFEGFGVFNGQLLRSRLVNDLIARVGVSGIVETGSFLGRTTEHLARSGLPVLSCELVPHIFMMASFRLNGYDNVRLFNCDSRTHLRNTLENFADVYRRPLFYLDAHWYDDLPLPEEVGFILENVPEYVIVIDDFEVKGSAYDFDSYPNGNELTLEFLLPRIDLSSRPVFLVPNRPASEETGLRRGTLVIVPQTIYDQYVDGIPLLKRIDVAAR